MLDPKIEEVKPQMNDVKPKKLSSKLIFLIILAVSILIIILVFRLDRYFRPDTVEKVLVSHRKSAPFLLILLCTVRPLTFIPASILSIPAGAVFGSVLGGLYMIIGIICGGSFAFWIGRYFGRQYVEKLVQSKLKGKNGFAEKLQKDGGFKTVLFFQFFPFLPCDIVHYGAGVSNMKYFDYLLATALGVIPGSFAFTYLGSALTDVRSGKFVLALLIIGLMSSSPLILKWCSKKRKTKQAKVEV